MSLSEFDMYDPYTCIFLMARVNESKRTKTKHYNQAWVRLQNEDTNQTLDYTKFKQIKLPDGFEDQPDASEEDSPNKGELLYIIGRIYCDLVKPDENDKEAQPYTKWIYEKFNKCISSARFPDLIESLSQLHCRARTEIVDQQRRIERAKEELIRIAEEKRQA